MAIPVAMAVMGAGSIIKSYGQYMANLAQAEAEEENASFYRDQASFAEETGRRQLQVFNDQTVDLFGAQESGFAKEGLGASTASYFRGIQTLQRNREAGSISREAEINVKLANLRAAQSQETAGHLRSYTTNGLQLLGNLSEPASSML